ncbi:MAG: bacteriohemerythrin [Magnetococcales bacterium]|nr:bacteriohemerythrin [Magnetococcales bacterium]
MDSNIESFEVFPWNDNFSIGIEQIDNQHKNLVDLINELTATLIQNDEMELTRVFDELATYAEYHFADEEKIWEKFFDDDKWLQSHSKSHKSFLPQIIKMKEELIDLPLSVIIEKIIKFLIRWLAFHIIDNDKRMATVISYMEGGKSLKNAKKQAKEDMSGATGLLIETMLTMYDGLSSRTLDLLRERLERIKAEKKLQEAYSKLEELATTDQLTGLFNRRHFDQIFEQEFRRAMRNKNAITFMMFDVDHFKKLNDRYGHIGGDVALKKIGTLLKQLCRRPGDFAFRLGGEEFGIITLEQSYDDAKEFAENLRTNIEDLGVPNVDSAVVDHMTVSIGLITKKPEQNDNPDLFMRTADDRLYMAKEQGRNQVVSSG